MKKIIITLVLFFVSISIISKEITIERTVTVYEIEKIQYKYGTMTSYQDITGDTLYIQHDPNGVQVDFKAVLKPTPSTWPGNKPKWEKMYNGNITELGTGEKISSTFTKLPSNINDVVTITAKGGNVININVIPFILDLDIDSDNDGIIEEEDDLNEFTNSKEIIFINNDNDNISIDNDYNNNIIDGSQDAIDLCEIIVKRLSIPRLENTTITLNKLGGTGKVRIFKKVNETMIMGPDDSKSLNLYNDIINDDLTLLVEGVLNGEVTLSIQLKNNNSIIFDKVKVTVVKLDIKIDSNNDSIINDIDEGFETIEPGKLLYLNKDDDNRNNEPDRKEITVNNEDDLQPINIICDPIIENCEIVISIKDEQLFSSPIKVWKNLTKGNISDTKWEKSSGSLNETLYIEGYSTGSATISLSYKKNSNELWKDEVKVGVVDIDFKKTNNTNYGYDDGEYIYPKPNTKDFDLNSNPGGLGRQKYDYVSIDQNNKTTEIEVNITPSQYAQYIYFQSSNLLEVTCSPIKAESSNQNLILTGNRIGTPYIQCRLGSINGAKANRFNVASYELKRVIGEYYFISDSGAQMNGTKYLELKTKANKIMKQAVSQLDLNYKGDICSRPGISIDLTSFKNNTILDLEPLAPYGPEWQSIKTAINSLGSNPGITVVHVKEIRVWIGNSYVISSGLSIPDTNFIIISDNGIKEIILAHEILHKLDLHDTGPNDKNKKNLMYFKKSVNDLGLDFLGYYNVEWVQTRTGQSWSPPRYEPQWDQIDRS